MSSGSWAQDFEIHVNNVGQGSSTSIKEPNGTLIHFDGGKSNADTDELKAQTSRDK